MYRKRVFNNPFNISLNNCNSNVENSRCFKNSYSQLLNSIHNLKHNQLQQRTGADFYFLKDKAPSWNNLANLTWPQSLRQNSYNNCNVCNHSNINNLEENSNLRRWNSALLNNNNHTNTTKFSTDNKNLKKNPNSNHETETIRLKSQDCLDRVQKCEYKFLQPAKPKPGRLVIKQEADIYEPAPPSLVVFKSPQPTFTPPTKMYHQRPPKSPEHIDEIIRIPGKKIITPQKTIVIEKPNTTHTFSELWKPYPPKEVNVQFVKEPAKRLNTCANQSCFLSRKIDDNEYLKIIEEIDWASIIIDQLKTRKLIKA